MPLRSGPSPRAWATSARSSSGPRPRPSARSGTAPTHPTRGGGPRDGPAPKCSPSLSNCLVAAPDGGNALQREGVLRAMSEFFERPVQGGRAGNDLEPMLFYDDVPPRVSAALARRMDDPDATIRRLALQASVAVRGLRDPAL